jgi:hypothetical protein
MIEVRRVCPLGFSGHTLDVLFSFLSSFRVRGFTVSASITNDILHAALHCSAHVQPWTTIFTVLQDKLRLRLESIHGTMDIYAVLERERSSGRQLSKSHWESHNQRIYTWIARSQTSKHVVKGLNDQ